MDATKIYQSRSKAQKRELIESWRTSGKNKKQFAIEHELSYQSFISWFEDDDRKRKSTNENSFVPLQVKDEHAEIFAEVILKNGSRVCFHQRVGAEYFQLLLK